MSFPNEIFQHIFDTFKQRCLQQIGPDGGVFFPASLTVLTCSLVCRDFLHFSRTVYFDRDIFFEQFKAEDEQSLIKLKILLKSPYQTLHPYLKQVLLMDFALTRIPGGDYDIFALTNEVNITKLTLKNISANFDQTLIQGFGKLTFFKTEQMQWLFDDLADFAAHHPGIEKLHIKDCDFYRPREGTVEEKISINTRRFSSELRYLFFGGTSADIVLNGLLPLCKLAKLTHVKLWDPFRRPHHHERNIKALQTFFERQGDVISTIEARNSYTPVDIQAAAWTSILHSYLPRTSAKEVTFEFDHRTDPLFWGEAISSWEMHNLEHLRLECHRWGTRLFQALRKNLTKKRFPMLRLIILKENRHFEGLGIRLALVTYWLDGKLY
ncbi:hypothetical protein BT69DRAFT_355065 [Atractiella rhizophila]|nr:hypothetical protein BT69DRAFT_355065 [Atractiella rhizophila]